MPQTILLALGIVLLNVIVQLTLKKGALLVDKSLLSISHLPTLIVSLASNVYVLASLVLLGISFLLWIFLLPRIQLSLIYPITISLNFVLVLIAARIIFQETISFTQFLGIIIVLIGIFFILK